MIRNIYQKLVQHLNLNDCIKRVPLIGTLFFGVIILYIFIFFIAIFLCGLHLHWLSNLYDESRLLQILLIFFIAIFNVFSLKKIKLKKNDIIFFLIIINFCLFLILVNMNVFQAYDLIMWIIVFIGLFFIVNTYSDNESDKNKIAILVLISILPCLFLPFTIYEFIVNDVNYDWQINSSSIRIYDSVIVPIFWLAIYLKINDNKIINKLYPVMCILIALALLMDSARSALISIIFPLLLLFIFDFQQRKLTINTIFYIFIAFIIYKSIYFLHDCFLGEESSLSIARLSTSYRIEIWDFMYHKWLEKPVFGVGGGYLAEHNFKYGHHMHNVYLRLIFEWGILGLVILLWAFHKVFLLFKSDVPMVLKMGVFAVLIDAGFSGSFIYPASQFSVVLLLGVAYSLNKSNTLENNVNNSKYLIGLWLIVLIYLVINFVGLDLICWSCSSIDGRAAPFFWEHGASKGLAKIN